MKLLSSFLAINLVEAKYYSTYVWSSTTNSPPTEAPTIPPTTDPRNIGCYKDSSDRDLDGYIENGLFTPETCMEKCKGLRFFYAGVQATDWCLCGNTYGKHGTASNCNLPCKADSSQDCGGHWANDVYSTGYNAGVNPAQCSDITGESGTGVFKVYPFGNDDDKISVFCDFDQSPAATYLNVDPATNYSKWTSKRLHNNAGHLCYSTYTQADWDKAGWSNFRKVRLNISHDCVKVDRTDLSYAKGTNQKAYGTAGDCYSWNECGDARKGDFKIDFTGRGVDIDWSRTGDWKANAWGNGNFIVNFEKTADTASASCGGWCGDCEPSTDIYLVADGSIPPPPERGMVVSRNNLYSTIPKLHKQWSLSVDIKPTGTVYGWSNILHVGIGGDHATYGDRTPGIWFHSQSTKLHIPSAINGNSNYQTDTDAIAMDSWTRVSVTQFRQSDDSYQYTISVGDNVIKQMTNSDARDFSDVKVYTSDDYYTASKALIDNLRISTFADGATSSYQTGDDYDYNSNGPIVSQGARMKRGVKFSVEATNDIHISLSDTDPNTASSWEIVLGGWAGKQSVIRSSHQGTNLVTIQHTADQFMEWQKNFEMKMTNSKIGLYDSTGATIIEYDGFDSTGVKYMYIATGWGSTGRWVINQQTDGFDYGRDPKISLDKAVGRFKRFLGDNFKQSIVEALTEKIDKIAEKLKTKYETLNAKCDLWGEPEDDDDDELRFDQQDPCKAAVQVSKSVMKWASVWVVNCRDASKSDDFRSRMQDKMDKVTARINKKLKHC